MKASEFLLADASLPSWRAKTVTHRRRETRPMSESVLVTEELTKSYGDRLAVRSLDLEVHAGEVFGFLGPNGAGKTTTIRMCLGLVRPTSGRALVLGSDVSRHGREVLPRVGALIESPA